MATAAIVTIEDLAKKLKSVFCAENKKTKKYAEVWLGEVDFGGLYHVDMVKVYVKAARKLESSNEEIKYIIMELFDQLTQDERAQIWSVRVYNTHEYSFCGSDDLLVYTAGDECA